MLLINYLSEYPKYVSILADWWLNEWGSFHPGSSFDHTVKQMQECLQTLKLPIAFVARVRDTPIGMVKLRACDFPTQPHLTPWLASLFVTPSHRGNGVAQQLIQVTQNKAHSLGYEKLYLSTLDVSLNPWYERLGWIIIREEKLHDHAYTLFEKRLT